MATEQKWNRSDQDGAVAAEESSPSAGGCLKERAGKKPLANDFHCQSKLSFSLTKQTETSQPWESSYWASVSL